MRAIPPRPMLAAPTAATDPTMPLTFDAYSSPAPTLLVALHSSGAGGRQWQGWRGLLPAAVDLRTPDLLGYGLDGWSDGATTTLDDEAQALHGQIAALPGGVHLLGHSYGGAVALQLALRWPQHVRSLTLYEPVRFALLREAEPALWQTIVAVGREIGALARAGRTDDAAARFVDYWSRAGAWQALAPQRRQAVAMRMPKVCAEFEALFGDAVPEADYRRLRLPVRVLAGTRSPRPALRVAERLMQLVPGAVLVRLDGLGHLGPIEDAARVAAQCLPPLLRPLPVAA